MWGRWILCQMLLTPIVKQGMLVLRSVIFSYWSSDLNTFRGNKIFFFAWIFMKFVQKFRRKQDNLVKIKLYFSHFIQWYFENFSPSWGNYPDYLGQARFQILHIWIFQIVKLKNFCKSVSLGLEFQLDKFFSSSRFLHTFWNAFNINISHLIFNLSSLRSKPLILSKCVPVLVTG